MRLDEAKQILNKNGYIIVEDTEEIDYVELINDYKEYCDDMAYYETGEEPIMSFEDLLYYIKDNHSEYLPKLDKEYLKKVYNEMV